MHKLSPKYSHTGRGFSYISFTELYGSECSLQKSSLATKDAIWLGIDEVKPVSSPEIGTKYYGRMHLDKTAARWLIKQLQHFVNTGDVKTNNRGK